MQWMRDRDLLIEETLAFAQRVAAVNLTASHILLSVC
jgi:hypothetical protein